MVLDRTLLFDLGALGDQGTQDDPRYRTVFRRCLFPQPLLQFIRQPQGHDRVLLALGGLSLRLRWVLLHFGYNNYILETPPRKKAQCPPDRGFPRSRNSS